MEQVVVPKGAEGKGKEKVSLDQLAKLTGFSPELIQEELFAGKADGEGVSLEELRSLMLNFIDATMLNDTETK